MLPTTKDPAETTRRSADRTPAHPSVLAGKAGDPCRSHPVCLEIPVVIRGTQTILSKPGEGERHEPFVEETRTVLVFARGAVVRLSASVSPGQTVVLANERMKKEVMCRVLNARAYPNVKGYVELEFTQAAIGFWGISFPSDAAGPLSAPDPEPTAADETRREEPTAALTPGNGDASATKSKTPEVTLSSPGDFWSSSFPVEVLNQSGNSAAGVSKLDPGSKERPAHSAQLPTPASAEHAFPASVLSRHEETEGAALSQAARPSRMSAAPSTAPGSKAREETLETFPLPKPAAPVRTGGSTAGPPSSLHEIRKLLEIPKPEPISLTDETAEADDSASRFFPGEEALTLSPAKKLGRRRALVGVAVALLAVTAAGGFFYLRRTSRTAVTNVAAASTNSSASVAGETSALAQPSDGSSAPVKADAVQAVVTATASGAPSRSAEEKSVASKTPTENAPQRKSLPSLTLAAPTAAPENAADLKPEAAPELVGKAPNGPGGILGGILSGGSSSANLPAPPAPELAAPIRVGGSVKAPKLTASVAPVYPTLAKEARVEGDVTIQAVIDATGRVRKMTVVSGPKMLQQAAVDALGKWRYEPLILNGKPESMQLLVTMRFRLR